ncbi:RHS repeat protein [Cysteiniphilum marinum]|uniref:RHS repeat protein n=1 Tax=Cysteiniphilum marinum TaxID=2774191 RepID=UPI00193A1256|nr:RHS repeat protein [Cysteiniphilum marinum]
MQKKILYSLMMTAAIAGMTCSPLMATESAKFSHQQQSKSHAASGANKPTHNKSNKESKESKHKRHDKKTTKTKSRQLAAVSNDSSDKPNYSLSNNVRLPGIKLQVNPVNGQLGVDLALLSIGGFTTKDISVSFHTGAKGMLGLPEGWRYGIEYVEDGRLYGGSSVYLIDPDWEDTDHYHSGLKYVNNHGLYFHQLTDEEPLPTKYDDDRSYAYIYTDSQGNVRYFDGGGKLIIEADRYGNAIHFYYDNSELSVEDAKLSSIKDSLGDVYTFVYGLEDIKLDFNDGQGRAHTRTLSYDINGITRYTDELGNNTDITYDTRNNIPVITQMLDPEGGEYDVSYTDLPYLNQYEQTAYSNAVETLSEYDTLNDDKLLSKTHYRYGTETGGHNYSGYPDYNMSSNEDSLHESNDENYQFDVEVAKEDEAGNRSNIQHIYYSSLGVPKRKETYLTGDQSDLPLMVETYAYPLVHNKHARSPNYANPKEIVSKVYDKNAPDNYKVISKVENQYDDYGQLTQSMQYSYNPLVDQLQKVKQTNNTYQDSYFDGGETNNQQRFWHAQTASKVTYFNYDIAGNAQDNTIDEVDSTLTANGLSVADSSAKENGTVYRHIAKTYDAHGVPLTQTVYSGDESQSVTTHYRYQFDGGKEMITETSPMGLVTLKTYDKVLNKLLSKQIGNTTDWHLTDKTALITLVDIAPGLKAISIPNALKANKSPKDAEVFYQYDLLGRVTQVKDAKGKTTNISYMDGRKDGQSSKIEVGNTGAIKKGIYLANGLEITEQTNVAYGQVQAGLHTIAKNSFNALGQKVSSTDQFNNQETYQYDSLGQVKTKTDADGNVTRFEHEYSHFATTTFVNDMRVNFVQEDPKLQEKKKKLAQSGSKEKIKPLLSIQYPYVNDKHPVNYGYADYAWYNSQNKLIYTRQDQVSASSMRVAKLSDKRQMAHQLPELVDGMLLADAFGISSKANEAQENKLINIHQSVQKIRTLTERSYQYSAQGNKIKETLQTNGSQVTYHYDYDYLGHMLGRQKQVNYADSQNKSGKVVADSYQYDADGNITKKIDAAGNVTQFTYNHDGELIKTTYPSGKTINQTYDEQTGEVIKETWQDSDGSHTKTYSYDDQGDIKTITLDGQTMSYTYDALGDTKTITYPDGMNVSYTKNKANQQESYTVANSTNTYVYRQDYTYDGSGRLSTIGNGKDLITYNYGTNANGIKGQLTKAIYRNLFTVSSEQDALGRTVATYKTAVNGQSVLDCSTSYDEFNRQTKSQCTSDINPTLDSSHSFVYDSIGQLAHEATTNHDATKDVIDYTYDQNGNMLTKTQSHS